tara:strand:- start:355 stop:2406 length:2052 start_codon:yes stop_codon:yes gene_type:complete
MNQPERDEAKYNRAIKDAREQMRLNWLSRSWDEYRDENINEKQFNSQLGRLRSAQMQKVRLMGQLDKLIKQETENKSSVDDIDFDKNNPELPSGMVSTDTAQALLNDIKALHDNEKVYLNNLSRVRGVILNDDGVPEGYERNNLARNAYISEFGSDPITGQPVTATAEQPTPPALSPRESARQAETPSPLSSGIDQAVTESPYFGADEIALTQQRAATTPATPSAPDVNPLNAARRYLWGEDMQPEFYQEDIPTDKLIPTALSRLNEQRSELQNRINSLESPTFVTRSSPYSGFQYKPVTETVQRKGDARMREDAAEAQGLLGELGDLNSLIQSMSPATAAPSSPAPAEPRTSGQTMGPEFFRQQSPQTLDQVVPIGMPAEAVQDQVGPSGMPASALIDMDDVGPSGMPAEAFDTPPALQSAPVGITDPRYVTPIPVPDPQSEMKLMEMDGSVGPAYTPTPTSDTGLMDMEGNPMPAFTAPPVRSGGLLMNQDGTTEPEFNFTSTDEPLANPIAIPAGGFSLPEEPYTGSLGPDAFRDATPDQKARDNKKRMLQLEAEGLRELTPVYEEMDDIYTAMERLQYATGIAGIGRALLRKFGTAFVKKLSKKSASEISDEVAQIQANQAARALARQRAAAQQTYTGAGAVKGGPSVQGLHGRFVKSPFMEYKIIDDLPKPPVPALTP